MKKILFASTLFLLMYTLAFSQTPMNKLTCMGNNMHLIDAANKEYAGKIIEIAKNDNVKLRLLFNAIEHYEMLIDKNGKILAIKRLTGNAPTPATLKVGATFQTVYYFTNGNDTDYQPTGYLEISFPDWNALAYITDVKETKAEKLITCKNIATGAIYVFNEIGEVQSTKGGAWKPGSILPIRKLEMIF